MKTVIFVIRLCVLVDNVGKTILISQKQVLI